MSMKMGWQLDKERKIKEIKLAKQGFAYLEEANFDCSPSSIGRLIIGLLVIGSQNKRFFSFFHKEFTKVASKILQSWKKAGQKL